MSSTWINRQKKDPFVKERNRQNVLSRSFFKIKEICATFNILNRNKNIILDLGCSPGGWCQFFKTEKQYIVGVDLLPIKTNIDVFIKQDIMMDLNTDLKFNNIFSDIAPNSSGDSLIDGANMCDIIDRIYEIMEKYMYKNGNIVIKVFNGVSLDLSVKLFKPRFKQYKIFKPKASRSESSEMYFIGLHYMLNTAHIPIK
jgi:23S rRNA (uridine2552-2'-O)-methyltransferase